MTITLTINPLERESLRLLAYWWHSIEAETAATQRPRISDDAPVLHFTTTGKEAAIVQAKHLRVLALLSEGAEVDAQEAEPKPATD